MVRAREISAAERRRDSPHPLDEAERESIRSAADEAIRRRPNVPEWAKYYPAGPGKLQIRLVELFVVMTAACGMFAVLRVGGYGVVAFLLGLAMVLVGVSLMDCRNVLVGQLLGAAIGLGGLLLASIVGSLSWDALGLSVILYAPLCTWVGGLWAGWRSCDPG